MTDSLDRRAAHIWADCAETSYKPESVHAAVARAIRTYVPRPEKTDA